MLIIEGNEYLKLLYGGCKRKLRKFNIRYLILDQKNSRSGDSLYAALVQSNINNIKFM